MAEKSTCCQLLDYSIFAIALHAPYETMLFKINKRNGVSYKDLYCQRYYTQQEAEEGHKDLLLRVERGEMFWKTI